MFSTSMLAEELQGPGLQMKTIPVELQPLRVQPSIHLLFRIPLHRPSIQSNRYGAFTYTIPGFTAGTKYIVNLHFADTYWNAPGKRQFNVLINGNQVLKNFDIVAVAGGKNVATVQSFLVTADSSGTITIQFGSGCRRQPPGQWNRDRDSM